MARFLLGNFQRTVTLWRSEISRCLFRGEWCTKGGQQVCLWRDLNDIFLFSTMFSEKTKLSKHFSPRCAIWSQLRPHMASFGTIWGHKTRRFSLSRVVKTTCFSKVSTFVGLPLVVLGVPKHRILRAFWASASLPRGWAKSVVISMFFWTII